MRITKKLLLLAVILLSGSQQSHALKKVLRVRPGMETTVEILEDIVSDVANIPKEVILWPSNSLGKNLLPQALKTGNIALAKWLFSLIDPDHLPIKKWREPLHDGNLLMHQILRKAVDNKSYYQCIELLQKKIDPRCCFHSHFYRQNIQGEYPLDIAFKRKLSKITIFLISLDQSNCCFNKRDDDYTLLHYATEYRLFEVITYLIKDFVSQWGHPGYLANSQPQDSDGWTPLHYASAKGDYEMCKLLLTLGGKADIKNHDKKTALELWPPNHAQEKLNALVGMIRTHDFSSERYRYHKNLGICAKKGTKFDLVINFKK